MKALVLAPFSQDALEVFQKLMPVIYRSWHQTCRLHSPDEMAEMVRGEGVGVLVVEADFVFQELFEQAPGLRLVGVCRSSVDQVDLDAATRHGVLVVYTPGRNAKAVAELTIGLMLSLARRIPQLHRYTTESRWRSPVEPYLCMRGCELDGKTLGVIGLGTIGRKVAGLARCLGMRVLGHDPFLTGLGWSGKGVQTVGLEPLLQKSDFVSVHCAAPGESGPLLTECHLRMMRAGAYLVNTASYSAVEEAALVDALHNSHLAGAALDVHITHPLPPSSPLLKLNNVILTPHIGGATEETVARHSWMMVSEIRRFLSGRRPTHLANREVWGNRV